METDFSQMKIVIYEEYAGAIHGNQRYIELLAENISAELGLLFPFRASLADSLSGKTRVDVLEQLQLWRRPGAVAKYIQSVRPDVLLLNNERSLLIATLGARIFGVPIVWYVKNYRASFFSDLACFLLASRVLAIAPQCIEKKGRLANMFGRKVFHLPIGIPLNRFAAVPEASVYPRLRALVLATIVPAKGVKIAVDAVRLALGKGTNVEMRIAGATPGKHRAFASQMCQEAKALPILWVGWQADVLPLFSWADIVILPSYSEGVPRSLVEAMAAGRPVVASRVGGIPSLVQDGVTGMLIEAGDAQGLADALATLADDPDGRRRMGMAAREYAVKHHDFAQHLRSLEQHLAEVAGVS